MQNKQSPYFSKVNEQRVSGYQNIVQNLKKRKANNEDTQQNSNSSVLVKSSTSSQPVTMANNQNNAQNAKQKKLDIKDFITYLPEGLENPDQVFDALMEEIQFEQGYVTVYGKTFKEPRLTSIHSDDPGSIYEYSSRKTETKAFTKTLEAVRNTISTMFNTHYNSVIVNYYRDGNDKIGRHSDKGNSIDLTDIVSISLGAQRTFIMHNKKSLEKVFEESLPNGSILRMYGECQRYFVHEVPAEPDITQPRINLTFRKMKQPSNAN